MSLTRLTRDMPPCHAALADHCFYAAIAADCLRDAERTALPHMRRHFLARARRCGTWARESLATYYDLR